MPSFKLTFSIDPDLSDELTGIFITMGMIGWEEDLMNNVGEVGVYFSTVEQAHQAKDFLAATFAITQSSITMIEDQDWNKKWRESMKPARLTDTIWVSPLWLAPDLNQGEHWIKIEPKMAFGTGHHESTRLAAHQLIAHRDHIKNKRVLDIGTGSGVLCFTADYLGCSFALGFDIDPLCGENLAENLQLNPATANIAFAIGELSMLKNDAQFDIVIMNMILGESAPLLPSVVSHIKNGALLVWSGILVEQKDRALEAAHNHGFSMLYQKTENEWWSATFAFQG